jgi:hypothetical protein
MSTALEVVPEVSPLATISRSPLRPSAGHRLVSASAAATIALLILLIGFCSTFEQMDGLDEGPILVYPELIQQGRLPYRDFETFYGPASPTLLAATFSLFGANIVVERTVGLLYRVAILLAIFAIVLPRGQVLAAGCMLLTGFLLLGTGLPAYAWFGAMACALWSLQVGSGSQTNRRCFFAGMLAGGAVLFRVDVAPAIILSALPLLYQMTWSRRRLYFAGGALVLVPLAILTLMIGWRPIISNLFLMPVIACNPARRLPLLSASFFLLALFIAHVAAATVNIAAGWIALRRSGRANANGLLLAIALFGIGLTHQAAQRLDPPHLLFAAFVTLGILPLSLIVLWSQIRNQPATPTQMWLAIVVVVALLESIAPELTLVVRSAFAAEFRTNSGASSAELDGRWFPFDSPKTAANVDQLLRKLDSLSKPGERLFVGPADLRRTNYNDTWIYHMLPKLTPASYFLEMNPFSANRPGSRLAADIATSDWLVLNPDWDTWDEPNRSTEYGSDAPNRVVRDRFELRGKIGGYLVFHRKG